MTTDMIMNMILLLIIIFAKLPLVELRLSVLRKKCRNDVICSKLKPRSVYQSKKTTKSGLKF